MDLHLEISLPLLVREQILEESLHRRLENAFWDPNSWNIMVVRPQSSIAGVMVNSEGITQWRNSQFSSESVYYCYSPVSIASVLTPGAVFTFLSRFLCSKVRVLLSLGWRTLSLVPCILYFTGAAELQHGRHFASSAFCFFNPFKIFCFFLQRKDCESVKHLSFSDYKFYSFPAWRALDHSFIFCFPQDPLIKSEGIVRIQRKSAISK